MPSHRAARLLVVALGFATVALGLVGWGSVRIDTSGDAPLIVRLYRRFREDDKTAEQHLRRPLEASGDALQ